MKSKLTTQEMQVLKENGVSVKKIAEIAGVTPSTICQRLNPEHYRELQKQWRDNHPDTKKNEGLITPLITLIGRRTTRNIVLGGCRPRKNATMELSPVPLIAIENGLFRT